MLFITDLQHDVIEQTKKSISHLMYTEDQITLVMRKERLYEFNNILEAVREDLRNLKVGGVVEESLFPEGRVCKNCGACKNCVQCDSCSHVFKIRRVTCKSCKTQKTMRHCPQCKGENVRVYTFKKALVQDGKDVCPSCKLPVLRGQHKKFVIPHVQKIEVNAAVPGEYKLFMQHNTFNGVIKKVKRDSFIIDKKGSVEEVRKDAVLMLTRKEACPECGSEDLYPVKMINVLKCVISKEQRHYKPGRKN